MPVSGGSLYGDALRAAVRPWREELGGSERNRLDAIVRLANQEQISLADCVRATFGAQPGQPAADQVKAFLAFCARINEVAANASPPIALRIHVDPNEKSPLDVRACWFTGPDPLDGADIYAAQITSDMTGEPLIPTRGIPTTGAALESGRPLVRFFVSYASADKALADQLLDELDAHFQASRNYQYQVWNDRQILIGEGWHQSIQRAIDACDFGLMLVSPSALGSQYIGEHELPRFVGEPDRPGRRPVVPVGLVRVDPEHHDMKGLQEVQIFRHGGEKCFGDLDRPKRRRDFAHDLFIAIEERLEAHYGSGVRARLDDLIPVPESLDHFQPPLGYSTPLMDLEDRQSFAEGRDALQEIEAWAVNPESPPFFALLGEAGMGKTTTLRQLNRLMLEKRKGDPQRPVSLYFDLRAYVGSSREAVPNIHELLGSIIEHSWKLSDRTLTPEAVLHLAREQGAVLLFDGLDERVVHLTEDRARSFIRTLWAALPDAARDPALLPPGRRRGKLLISCRSHYFRDIGSQNAMLVGEGREGIDGRKYQALYLLPFTESQIKRYLMSVLGNDQRRVDALLESISAVHNLFDLVRRPYLLKLIAEQADDLEELRRRGKTGIASRIYETIVRKWLYRDGGRHEIDPGHKKAMMEALAASMWRSGARQWGAERLGAWLDAYLAADPVVASAYASTPREVLKRDLYTATFILRPDDEQEQFRFAHTSFQEYFLALHLVRALAEGKVEAWDIPMVSDETLDFLGQVLKGDPVPQALQTLARILEGGSPPAALLALRYWLRANRSSYPAPSPARVKLAGANLEGWTLSGKSPELPFSLRGADLTSAKLSRARLENVDLGGADLAGAEVRQALFLRVNAARASFRGADLAGLQWREGSLAGAELTGARLRDTQWLGVDLDSAALPPDWSREASAVELSARGRPRPRRPESATLAPQAGHSGLVSATAWSPDGERLVSGSHDSTLKIWDTRSGRCLLTLEGHGGPVVSCAWSPDGEHIVSGSEDSTLRIWDPATGKCARTLDGNARAAWACGWSPDSRKIVSGASSSLRIWEVSSGRCLRVIQAHDAAVRSCAWSPDGQRIASGSAGQTGGPGELKIWVASTGVGLVEHQGSKPDEWQGLVEAGVRTCAWSPDSRRLVWAEGDTLWICDAGSGERLASLQGSASLVLSCAWSRDGRRILSSSIDGTIKIWDGQLGQCLATLESPVGPISTCGWSPDGERVASGAEDGMVRIWTVTPPSMQLKLRNSTSVASSCAFSPDGGLVATGSKDGYLRIWERGTGRRISAWRDRSGCLQALAWSADGARMVFGTTDHSLRVWEVGPGRCSVTLSGHSGWVLSCAWSPDGQRVVSASEDATLKVWEVETGRCALTLQGHRSATTTCAWSPDGAWILSGSRDESLRLWDAATGRCTVTYRGHQGYVRACAWSPDSTQFASGANDPLVMIWGVSSGHHKAALEGHSGAVLACQWSPDGQRLASGSRDGTLRVWEVAMGRCCATLNGHAGPVLACAWSRDGRLLCSTSSDGTVKIWDAETGACLWTAYLFAGGQSATVDGSGSEVLDATPEAWRWMGLRVREPGEGRWRIIPFDWPAGAPAEG